MAESILICRHNKNGTGYCECLGEYCVEGPCTAEELIEYAPVRHGRWLLERTPDGKPYCFHCSVCDDDFHHIGIMTVYDYCPNCGAYMMGESNGKCE